MMMIMMRIGIIALCLCAFLRITACEELCVVGADFGRTINMSWAWAWLMPRPTEPLDYIVGDILGWTVPPGGNIFYNVWARTRTFIVGDALIFLFIDNIQDVAVVSKEAYENCETKNPIAVYSSSPTRIVLNIAGEYFFTSTYKGHCVLGQKLAINVTSNISSSSSSPSSSPTLSPTLSPKVAFGPSGSGSAHKNSASRVVSRCITTFFFVVMSLLY